MCSTKDEHRDIHRSTKVHRSQVHGRSLYSTNMVRNAFSSPPGRISTAVHKNVISKHQKLQEKYKESTDWGVQSRSGSKLVARKGVSNEFTAVVAPRCAFLSSMQNQSESCKLSTKRKIVRTSHQLGGRESGEPISMCNSTRSTQNLPWTHLLEQNTSIKCDLRTLSCKVSLHLLARTPGMR